jgi:hypothetical protein|tara:strand:+ start:615 stop:1319 length:705 start_codon:yes stop_codon:yes gene_type:complete
MVTKKRKIRKFRGGGMDASKADFSSPPGNTGNKGSDHGHTRFESGSGYYGETRTNTNTGGAGKTTVNTPPATTPKDTSVRINPVTVGLNIAGTVFGKIPGVGYAFELGKKVQKATRTQTARGETLFGNPKKGNPGMPITRDYYRATGKPLDVMSKAGTNYMKEAGFLKNKGYVDNTENSKGVQLCPDGSYPPCKTPVTQIKKPVSKPNTFLSGFQAYDDGGEVVISSNVDKSLL